MVTVTSTRATQRRTVRKGRRRILTREQKRQLAEVRNVEIIPATRRSIRQTRRLRAARDTFNLPNPPKVCSFKIPTIKANPILVSAASVSIPPTLGSHKNSINMSLPARDKETTPATTTILLTLIHRQITRDIADPAILTANSGPPTTPRLLGCETFYLSTQVCNAFVFLLE